VRWESVVLEVLERYAEPHGGGGRRGPGMGGRYSR